MSFLAIGLITMLIFGVSTLCFVRPEVIVGWAKRANPNYAGDGSEIIWVIKLIGGGGFFIGLYIVAIFVRAILR
jgi:hypothetical protein